MTASTAALIWMTGLALLFSMGALLGLVVLHHKQNSTYDNDTCAACDLLKAEMSRQAKALSDLWRYMEAVDDRRPEVHGTAVPDREVGARH